MFDNSSAAFLSYVHSDDDHDGGRISRLRERLEGEVRMHMGYPFRIFQDRNDLEWGQSWANRIDDSLNAVSFLIPVITPSFFRSPACRKEFDTFFQREQTLGIDRLILPIYYLDTDEMEESSDDKISEILRSRQWSDWRNLRFFDLHGPDVSAQLASQALMIKRAIRELGSLFSESPTANLDALIEARQAQTGKAEVGPSISLDKKAGTTPTPTEKPRKKRRASHDFEYKAFTREFDETIRADQLINAEDSVELGRRAITLAEKISDAHSAKIKNYESSLDGYENVALSILVDNSGSLRGEKISATAAWCILLLEFFDRINWKTELVGFTTRSWKGGQSREKWLKAGRPPSPGRLADLRYIIYKEFSDSVVGCAQSIGTMLKEGILKENIDGEAVELAFNRLSRLDCDKKIILVLSDGAPVDDSTLSVNSGSYLENHLRQVLKYISKSDISILAVGIEHDVKRYYGKDSVLANNDNLGLKALELVSRVIG